MRKTKIVFEDSGKNKIAVGRASFENGFVKLECEDGNTLYINKNHIGFMKEADY